MSSMSSAPEKGKNSLFIAKIMVGTAMALTGIAVILSGRRKKEGSHLI